MDATAMWCAAYGACSGRIVWFDTSASNPPAAAAGTRLLLKVFGDEQPLDLGAAVHDLQSCGSVTRSTFPDFCQHLAGNGFGFLRERLASGRVGGPVLVAVAGRRIVGGIGPMQTMPDRRGTSMLLPQYFGVLPEQRGRGYGRALWRAATRWGHENRAAYQLLQTTTGGAADRLYKSEGLASLGLVYSVTA